MSKTIKAYEIRITGIVQGVGFRPHVYRLAREFDLKGWVLNSSAGVVIEAEGEPEKVRGFMQTLLESPPPLAQIRSWHMNEKEPQGYAEFNIRHSANDEAKTVMISPDIATCPDCKSEVRSKQNRRFNYPFTNCTNCGPRFTIIKDVPYDRALTTMAPFPMCVECRREYEDPRHRRFHAQPNACPACGPHVTIVDASGREVKETALDLLKQGKILAVKGLGAFHLAVDAHNEAAVKELRRRKQREAKPFAVMARDIETACRYCRVNSMERRWLESVQAPIVILARDEREMLPDEAIHPGIDTLGVMLPYTPLHYLLFDEELDLLIMTSANISDEPLIIDNDQALASLKDVADYFLVHNREIYNPCDDSVMRITSLGTPQLYRRARGFVPLEISLPIAGPPVLALGGELKNTFCLTREGEAYLSQHWGDLNHYGNYRKFLEGIPRFKKMLAVEPELLVHDLHPNYQTTRWAKEQKGLPRLAVQHHWAHLAAVMAENGLNEEILGVICDGTGWDTDGTVWGCEILKGDYRSFSRLAHLKYVPLPGGDVTAKKPYRMALVYLLQVLGEEGFKVAEELLPQMSREEAQLVKMQMERGLKVVYTSSAGRLFDAVSAVLGICSINRYEGQAPIELERYAAGKVIRDCYPYVLEEDQGTILMNVFPMWREIVTERLRDEDVGLVAARFHFTIVQMLAETLLRLRDRTRINLVGLSGGVFHNQIILVELIQALEKQGFKVYQHQKVPPGDGGISLGQAVIGAVKLN